MAIRTSPSVRSDDPIFQGRRISGRSRLGGGAAPVAGDFALSAGFGTTASVAVTAGSTESQGEIVVTSAGTGQGANPTITYTFPGGAYSAAPEAYARRAGGSQATVAVDAATASTTAVVITFRGTPVAAETYTIKYFVAAPAGEYA